MQIIKRSKKILTMTLISMHKVIKKCTATFAAYAL